MRERRDGRHLDAVAVLADAVVDRRPAKRDREGPAGRERRVGHLKI